MSQTNKHHKGDVWLNSNQVCDREHPMYICITRLGGQQIDGLFIRNVGVAYQPIKSTSSLNIRIYYTLRHIQWLSPIGFVVE